MTDLVTNVRPRADIGSTWAQRLLMISGLWTGCAADEVQHIDLGVREQLIVGGSEAQQGAWPTVVSVRYDFSSVYPFWCGGTLIAPDRVLTAAHCVYSDQTPGRYDVIVGRHDLTTSAGQTIAVSAITVHPSYTGSGSDNDIAILTLQSALTAGTPLSRLVTPGRMPEILAGNDVTALGWGDTSEGGSPSNTLQGVTIDVIGTGATCNAASDYTVVTSNEICIGDLAGGHDTCQGDSGGPAFVLRDGEWFQLGATSWGTGCARADLPGVYTYLPNYVQWIHSNAPGMRPPSLLPSAQIVAIAG